MDPTTTFLILMLAIAVLALVASRLSIPYPTMMVVGGLLISFIPGLNKVEISPNLIFNLFLPPLLYGAAWQISWKEFWSNRRPIFLLAVGLVLFTTLGVAALAMHFIPEFTWPAAFALGAIISPPDAIAVTALTKKIRLPHRLVFLLEGESLVNDAAALVALKFAVQAGTGAAAFSLLQASGSFVIACAGGVLLGLAIAWIAAEIHRRLQDPLIETIITFLTPYAAYLLGERLHFGPYIQFSGVLATVTAGLYLSWRAPVIMKPQVRLESRAIWDFVLFLLNGFVFVLVGLGLPAVMLELQKSPDYSTRQLVTYGFIIVAGIIFLRMAWVIPGAYLPWYLSRKARRTEKPPALRQVLLLGWIGMRGAVSLAAALTIMMPQRGMIIFLTFFIILVTLVLQSLTLPMVIHLLGAHTAEDQREEERQARLHAARQALNFLRDLVESTDAFGNQGTDLKTQYEARIVHLESGPAPLPVLAVGIEISGLDLQREVLSAERQAIVELRANQKISTDIFHRLMADVDAEEMRLATRH